MRRVLSLFLLLIPFTVAVAQDRNASAQRVNTPSAAESDAGTIMVPSGTQIPLVLKQAISTKNAKPGDAVYAETNFPITINDKVVIPAGTYVQGRITEVKRAGRVKGKAQLLMHFTTLVFPTGYTAMLPGAVDNMPGAEKTHMKGDEGKVEQDSSKGKDAGTIATTAGTGATIGALADHSLKGAGIGGLAGAAAGLGYALLTRGPDVMLPVGTSIEMVLQRDLKLKEAKIER
jgi:acetyltransferase-like isoleucine patch superfamily enzyme